MQGGVGGPLAPNLTDDVWINIDGSYESIVRNIMTGVPEPKEHPGSHASKGRIGYFRRAGSGCRSLRLDPEPGWLIQSVPAGSFEVSEAGLLPGGWPPSFVVGASIGPGRMPRVRGERAQRLHGGRAGPRSALRCRASPGHSGGQRLGGACGADPYRGIPGDGVEFRTVDHRVHTLRFLADSLTYEARAFLESTGQMASPPLVSRGSSLHLETSRRAPWKVSLRE